MHDIVLTGAHGFVGSFLCRDMKARGHSIHPYSFSAMADGAQVPFPAGTTSCVHLGARVHVMKETSHDPLTEYRRVNTHGTLELARRAAEAGCRRFVFVSTIKVNGEATAPGRRFTADDAPAPEDSYGLSKQEAETGLRHLSAQTGMDVVIVRPPLVYGPGVGANFLSMMTLLDRRLPLPFGSLDNRRSLVSLTNLSDFIATCLDHPAAANEVFLVSDDEDVSTKDLLIRLGHAMQRPARLIPVPPGWLGASARMLGKGELAKRILGSLAVDIAKSRDLLGWRPPATVDEGLGSVADWYRHTR